MLTDTLLQFIDEQRFGYVATVSPDGAPNLSPKGTFLALDHRTLAFAEMRSPNTVRNIANDPRVEINMVDVFARKGARFRGEARFVARADPEFDRLYPRWQAIWGDELGRRFNGFMVISIVSVLPLSSPAYDIGGDERALREEWLARHIETQRRHLDA